MQAPASGVLPESQTLLLHSSSQESNAPLNPFPSESAAAGPTPGYQAPQQGADGADVTRSGAAPEPKAGLGDSAEAVAAEQIRLGLLDDAEKGHAQPEAATRPAQASSSSVKGTPAAAGTSTTKPAAPLDVVYIQSLIEDQLGPPKFAVPKESQAPPNAPPPAPSRLSLEELLDKEFGPPKFAVPKTPGAVDEGTDGQHAQPSGTKRAAGEEDVAADGDAGEAEVPLLTLRVTAGPAAGAQFVVDDDHLEVRQSACLHMMPSSMCVHACGQAV